MWIQRWLRGRRTNWKARHPGSDSVDSLTNIVEDKTLLHTKWLQLWFDKLVSVAIMMCTQYFAHTWVRSVSKEIKMAADTPHVSYFSSKSTWKICKRVKYLFLWIVFICNYMLSSQRVILFWGFRRQILMPVFFFLFVLFLSVSRLYRCIWCCWESHLIIIILYKWYFFCIIMMFYFMF